jgi:hypothetical protein
MTRELFGCGNISATTGLRDAVLSPVARRMRVATRLVALALSSLLLLAGLLLISVTMWLQTTAARGWIESTLAREVNQQLALTLTVGRIAGDILRGIRLEQVELHDAQGRLVARADALSARYRLRGLARGHEVDEITVVRPVIARLPSPAGAPPQGEPTELAVHRLTVTDGSLRWDGHEVQHLSANTTIQSGAQGQRLEGEVTLIFDEQPLLVRGTAERDDTHARVQAEIHGAAFDARGHGDWAEGRITAKLESLDVDPKLLASARPLAGRGVLHARGDALGPLDALDVKLHGHTDDRGFAFGALVDVPRRTARLTAFVAAPTRSAALQARVALHGDALDVTALEAHTGATLLTGAARIGPSGLDAALTARVAPAEAAVIGIRPAAPIRLRVALNGPPRALAVRVRGSLRAAQVALDGRVDVLARSGGVRFVAHGVRPSEIVEDAPDLSVSGAFTFDGALQEHTGLEGTMSVTDGTVRVAGRTFERLHGTGSVKLGRSGEALVEPLSGQLRGRSPRQINVQTMIRWDPQALRVDANRVVVDENHGAGEVVYTHDPITQQPLVTIRAERLSLSPPLVEKVVHRRPAKAWSGNADVAWTPTEGFGLTFVLDTEEGLLKGDAKLRGDRDGLELSRIFVAIGGSHLRGAARVKNGEIVASIDELILQPQLVHRLWPALELDRTVRVEGVVAGPLHALDLDMLAFAGASTARLRGKVDLPARRFELVAILDTFYLQSIKETRTSRINLELALAGRIVEGGMAGTLTVRHAWGKIEGLPLDAARLDVKLDGPRFNVNQVLIGVPGAVLEGSGGGTWHDFNIGYGVVVTNALALKKVPQDLRVLIGFTALTPGRTVVGSIQRHGGGKIEFAYRTIPPPFRVVNLLYHLLAGHPLHLTVH